MATLYIDNKPYTVTPGKNLLETCLTLGFDLPYFCWHPALGSVGACRQCAIKIFKDANDKKGRLMMSCMEPVTDNQYISISDPEAHEFREHVVEWLMTNHPHDCAVCDEGGSCHLQDVTVMTGHAYRRFHYKKRTYRNQYLGPFINHEMNRCIQCYRCVRFYKDYAGGRDLDVFAAHNHVYFGRSEDGILENEFSGNLAEVCPTGVFTDKTLKQHYTRKWDLTMAPSVCQHCSLGCNTIAGERYGELRVITNRYNGEVNGYFLCDRGRFGYSFVNAPTRIRKPLRDQHAVTPDNVMEEIASLLRTENVIGIGAARASLESNFILKKLVGDDRFYCGVADQDYTLTALALDILTHGTVRTLSIKEVEKCDAVFILGEDLTNTAPRLALAVRQTARQEPMEQLNKINVPQWHDAAAREFIQEEKGPVFIASIAATKLDDIARQVYYTSPDAIARIGLSVANLLDGSAPFVSDLSPAEQSFAQQIARALVEAKRPVIIAGTSCRSEALLHAAANISQALHKKNPATGLVLTLSQCNSMGLAMMGGKRLKDAFKTIQNGHADTVIILENDLYQHAHKEDVDQFLQKCKRVIVIDHTTHGTVRKADIVIPAGTFAEADGTIVSNEGRAQRFFQVFEPADDVKESWRWLLRVAAMTDHQLLGQWTNIDDITQAIANEIPALTAIRNVVPPASFRVNGQRIPREPHRYSGRTAMHANVKVSEEKPPEDPDSGLSYTMEGFRGLPPSSMIPFFWAPGWNSVQSVNKYQQEVGSALQGGDPGIRLIVPASADAVNYFTSIPEVFKPVAGKILLVPLHHIFGSDALSAQAPAVAERVPKPYIMISMEDAKTWNKNDGDEFVFDVDGETLRLTVKVSTTMSQGMAGVPFGLPGVEFVELPVLGTGDWALGIRHWGL